MSTNEGNKQIVTNYLPDCILLQIFSFLSLEDRCILQLVAKRWSRILQDTSLWKEIDISKEKDIIRNVTDSVFEFLLSKYGKSVKVLILEGCARLTDQSLNAIANCCPALQILNLNGCLNMTHNGFTHVACNCTMINTISIYMTGATEETCYAFLDRGNITSINLPGHVQPTRIIKKIVENCKSLKSLGVNDVMPFVDDDDFSMDDHDILALSSRLPMIEQFTFNWCSNVSDMGLMIISVMCPKLKKLHLRECHSITLSGLEMIMANCLKLEVLTLEQLFLNKEKRLLFVRRSLANLKQLKLNDTSLTEEAIMQIISIASNLEIFHLHDSSYTLPNFSERTLAHLAEHCTNMKKLKVFVVRKLDIASMLDHVMKLSNLETLEICYAGKLESFDLEKLLESCQRLNSVEIKGCEDILRMPQRSQWIEESYPDL